MSHGVLSSLSLLSTPASSMRGGVRAAPRLHQSVGWIDRQSITGSASFSNSFLRNSSIQGNSKCFTGRRKEQRQDIKQLEHYGVQGKKAKILCLFQISANKKTEDT